ncbi:MULTISPECIES: hypothetical protein [Actinoalloteichus]|uniref:hypothetical protein n=1 Tax=Actinoalloteichus TaxID=65496 RepID=UPI0012FC57B1|nr:MULTISPECIES: hypothetical protein [Actinoalloteichus]
MNGLAWFVQSVRMGDTHLADADWDGGRVRPVCAPAALFVPMNRNPLVDLYYEDQPCTDCLADVGVPGHLARPPLAVVR